MDNENKTLTLCSACGGEFWFPNEGLGMTAPCPHCGSNVELIARSPNVAVPKPRDKEKNVVPWIIVGIFAVVTVILTSALIMERQRMRLEKTEIGNGATAPALSELDKIRVKAGNGDILAQAKLGLIYGNGHGVPVDYIEAEKWYRKAAEQGDANAQNNLGLIYSYGLGFPTNYPEASNWFRKSAERDLAKAQLNLGEMYDKRLILENKKEALVWFRKAAEQGYIPAQTRLAFDSKFGFGVPEDITETEKWYRKAAEQGDAGGEVGLAMIYMIGPFERVLPLDNVEAYKWLYLASEQGEQGFANVLDEETQAPSAEQIANSEKARRERSGTTVNLLVALSRSMSQGEIDEAKRRAEFFLKSSRTTDGVMVRDSASPDRQRKGVAQ